MMTDSPLSTERVFKGLARSIGGTPLLAIQCSFRGHSRTLFAKAEHLNPTGSIKDRIALHVLRAAYDAGNIHAGFGIVEATKENTAIAFSAIGRALGHPVTVFVPDWMSDERKSLIRSFGATTVPVTHEGGGFPGSVSIANERTEGEGDIFLPHQFSKTANCAAHEQSTGPEIWYQLKARDLRPDAFVAGVGTGGTVLGVGRFLRLKDPSVRVHPLEPRQSPTLSTGCKVGKHRIPGISDESISGIPDLRSLDSVIQVSDGDAILMAGALAAKLRLGVGVSSGANFLGALLVQEELGPDSAVATVFPDDSRKYLSTHLLGGEPIRDDFISPEVELLGYDILRRSCRTCSDLEECRHWADAGFDPREA